MDSISGASAPAEKPKFSEVWDQIQAKMGVKEKPQRKIKKTLDKDDFLRIMITQMQHQDPTKPFEADKLASEIAQITSVEQLSNVNKMLDKMSKQDRPLERLAMTNLIGKVVTVDRSRFKHTEGHKEQLSFSLPRDAKAVKVQVVHESGEVVFEKELGETPAGQSSFVWDGKKSNTLAAPSGRYSLRVEGQNAHGLGIPGDSRITSRVVGVSYNGKEPVLLIGDGNSQERVELSRVITIKEGALPAVGVAQERKLPAHVRRSIEEFEMKRKQGAEVKPKEETKVAATKVSNVSPKPQITSAPGFPNGLDFFNENSQSMKGGEQK